MSKIKEIRIEKLCLHIGVGEAGDKLKKAKLLLERITGGKAVITKGKKKVPSLGVRPGLPIGVKVTLRKNFKDLLKRLIEANENVINKKSFTSSGVSFGIEEYLHIPGVEYDPEIGIMGMDVIVVLKRPGFRVSKRRLKKSKIGKKHLISVDESIKFMKDNYEVIFK
jgi:large subunit ribosomal protein L5